MELELIDIDKPRHDFREFHFLILEETKQKKILIEM